MSGEAPRLTAEQGMALAVRGAGVALSAGAGCGKTTVLTARFLAELEAGGTGALGSIAALTFTEKAARELRGRVRRECRRKLDEGTDPARWLAISRGLEAAPIGTFHGFCGNLLRRFPIEAGVDPGFAILEESIAPTLRAEALDGRFRAWLVEENLDFIALAIEFGIEGVRESLEGLIAARTRGEIRDWIGCDVDQVIAAWRLKWETEVRPARLRQIIDGSAPCLGLMQAHPCTHDEMKRRRDFLTETMPTLVDCDDPIALLEKIAEHARVHGAGTKKHWPTPEIYETVRDGLSDLRDSIKSVQKHLTIDEEATREAAEHGLRLARLTVDAMDAYERAKRRRGLLDFDDLLLKTRELLSDPSEEIRKAIADDFGVLLVDEFQDTDPIQGKILDRLSEHAGPEARLFLVGDSKQSIYRFRGAQPRVFQEFRDGMGAEGRLALTENFRSVPAILDFANALFADTFPDPGESLKSGPGMPPRDDRVAVEFLWAVEGAPDSNPKARAPAFRLRQTEARWIARRLAHRLEEGWPIHDRATGKLRDAHAGDVALLFRSLNDAGAYEEALVDAGLDYHVVGGSAYFAQQEVIDLVNVLSAIEDPLDALALAGTLRSPFFCVSDNGLYWLATFPAGDLPLNFERWERISDLTELDRPRVRRASDLLSSWRSMKDRMPIAALVDRVLDDSGYEAALLGDSLGPRRRANVRKLVRLARRFDRQGDMSLADFVARLRADLRKPPKEEQAATTEEEGTSIRLMTIHQAKGLEFPIVVVPDLDRKPPMERSSVAFHPELGPLVRPSRESFGDDDDAGGDEGQEEAGAGSRRSLGWSIYRHIEEREEAEEALRLFYVAITRARDSLILSSSRGPDQSPTSHALKLLDRRFDRSTGLIRDNLPDGWTAPRVNIVREAPPLPAGADSSHRMRPPLLSIASAIDDAAPENDLFPDVGGSGQGKITDRRPRLIDLDPAASLDPTASRVDRLIRTILADPRAFEPKQWESVIARAALRQDPSASRMTRDLARERLAPWLASPLARRLARADRIVRAIPWSIAWPPESDEPTTFLGRLDFAYRDPSGEWELVNISDPQAPEAPERLRLLLSAEMAPLLDIEPIVGAWRVRLGVEFTLQGEASFDRETIDEAVRQGY